MLNLVQNIGIFMAIVGVIGCLTVAGWRVYDG